jgi:predicted O-methyltransferase YrrM
MSVEIIRKIFDSVPGMILEEEGLFLYNLAARCIKGTIVEIGSSRGRSTICLAKGSKSGGNMTVYAVDPHNGGNPTKDPTWRDISQEGTPNLKYYVNQGKSFPQFRQALLEHCVDDIVAPLVDYSELVYKKGWTRPIELLFIDGEHRYNYVKMDVEMWGKHLISGGIILMHDSSYPGVRRVINELIIPSSRFTDIKESPIFNATVI